MSPHGGGDLRTASCASQVVSSRVYIDMQLATVPQSRWRHRNYDGIFGMGPDSAVGNNFTAPFSLVLQHQHFANIFALDVGLDIGHAGGVLSIGVSASDGLLPHPRSPIPRTPSPAPFPALHPLQPMPCTEET